MIRRPSRRMALRARAVEKVRALTEEFREELAQLGDDLALELDRQTRPTDRAQATLLWARLSTDALIRYVEATGDDLAAYDSTAEAIIDELRRMVGKAVPAVLSEADPLLGAGGVDELVASVLDTVKAAGTPLTAAIPTLAAVLSWQVAVFDAVARLDVRALHRLSIVAPYETARKLAEILGGVMGPTLDRVASRLACRTRATAELGIAVATHRANRCRRRGPPGDHTSPRPSRHVVGTSPNAPPTACALGALRGPLSACGRSRRRTVPI